MDRQSVPAEDDLRSAPVCLRVDASIYSGTPIDDPLLFGASVELVISGAADQLVLSGPTQEYVVAAPFLCRSQPQAPP